MIAKDVLFALVFLLALLMRCEKLDWKLQDPEAVPTAQRVLALATINKKLLTER
jgi:hypothetical protein